jgi:Trehalose utilisation.
MRSFLSSAVIIFIFLSCQEKDLPGVLVFSKTKENRHESIPAGKQMMLELGAKNKIRMDTTEDATLFSDTTLARYDA